MNEIEKITELSTELEKVNDDLIIMAQTIKKLSEKVLVMKDEVQSLIDQL